MHRLKRVGLLALGSCALILASCNASSVSLSADSPFTISASTNTVKVGESLDLSINFPGEEERVIWISENESIASVDLYGKVTGNAVGQVIVTARSRNNLSKYASIQVNVIPASANPEKKNRQELAITKPLTSTEFTQGSFFDYEGLEVTLYTYDDEGNKDGGIVIDDFVTNPLKGTYLGNIGSFKATISYGSALSTSFDYTVVVANEDDSLKNVLTKLDDQMGYSGDHTYKVEVSGDLLTSSGYSSFSYSSTYTKNAYYYSNGSNSYGIASNSEDIVNDDPSKAHKAGLFYYNIKGNQIVPSYYYSHTSRPNVNDEYGDSPVNQFNMFDPSEAPTRLINKSYFVYSDSEVVKNLLGYIGLDGESYQYLVNRVQAKVLSETSFEIDMQLISSYGSFKITVSEIGTATLPYIDDYLKEGKGGKDAESVVFDVDDLVLKNNYTVSLGNAELTTGSTISKGNLLVSEDFYYYDYSTEYINAYNNTITEDQPKLYDWGYAKLSDGRYHKFKAKDVEGENLELDSTTEGSNYPTLGATVMKKRYLSSAKIFSKDNGDTFTFVESSNTESPSLYISYSEDLVKEIATNEFSSLSQTTYTPVGMGIGDVLKDDKGALTGFSLYYLIRNSGTIYQSTKKYTDFGTTTSAKMTDFIAKNN